jgi:hypothetical protein
LADRPGPWIELKAGDTLHVAPGKITNDGPHEARQAPPQPEGRVVAHTVQIDVREALDLHTGYSREGWHEFLWLSGWRARVAVFVLKALS